MIQIASDAEGAALPITLTERMARAFSPDGRMAQSPDFEYRPQQQRMAKIVGRALEVSKPVVIEAATGVGKSLAYLLPAITFALEEGRKAIITTHTINLQEQLILKDIPIVQKLYPTPFKAELLKGRGNYLCPQRLERAFHSTPDLFTPAEQTELKLIWEWSQRTKDGTLSDLDFSPSPKVWSQVCSEAHICTPRRCPPHTCFYQAVRRRMAEAHVLVMNHSLFFTLLSSADEAAVDEANFLFPLDFLIVDEAHTIENVAARAYGLHLSESHLKFELQRLFNPRTRKGFFPQQGEAPGTQAVREALDAVGTFFEAVEGSARFAHQAARESRVREPGLVEDSLTIPLHKVIERAQAAGDAAKSDTVRLEIHDLAKRLIAARNTVKSFLDQEEDEHVYWVERSGGDNRTVSIHSAPVDVSAQLNNLFFRGDRACILTSATLGAGEGEPLSYFRKRVGGTEAAAVSLESPFDFQQQMKLYVARNIPPPGTKKTKPPCPTGFSTFWIFQKAGPLSSSPVIRRWHGWRSKWNRSAKNAVGSCWCKEGNCRAIRCWRSFVRTPIACFSERKVFGQALMCRARP